GHHQDTKVRVNIKVKDVNDNAPEFATQDEVLMCENINPGTVTIFIIVFCPKRRYVTE
ncbi:cadherin-11 precursor, partial [Silurus meridionalis]